MAEYTIDRESRARQGAEMRVDKRLTAAEFRVGQAILFGIMGALGRAWPSYDRIAEAAGVCRRTAVTAVAKLVKLGYLIKTRRWGKGLVQREGRWMPHCLTNMYVWAKRISAKAASNPRPNNIKEVAHEPMPPELVKVLARFGNLIADRNGLPQSP